ncbi:hypothetical protein AURDEDRAFT_175861 [Auricularia subglabra TFB-10046 SS5]|nr:hypothetical protein AURDEDRAFT_175861 [Auricularia subglabra TFB-10046 SS5]
MAATFPSFLRAVNGEPQFDYTRTTDERLARHVKVELLNYFPPESALRFRLQDPADRFMVAYPGLSMGLFVQHSQLKVVDDVRNCVYVIDRSLVTPRGVNIETIIHDLLGLSADDLYETIQLCTRSLPWVVESAQETLVGEDEQSFASAAVPAPEPTAENASDSPPGLLAVSDSSVSDSSEEMQSLSSASDDGGHMSAPAQPGSAWQEYLFSAHGARWLRNHARPRRGASPAQFYDYESDGTQSA